MKCPTLEQITPQQTGKKGWPWSIESPQLAPLMNDGRAWPKISIVTPSFNQGEFLEETIRSILLQGYPNLEYIIIDGGSKDNSVEIIKKYERWLKYWISEEDTGQANAINKGLKHCSGDLFNWINSDDYLEIGALRIIAEKFDDNDVVAGSVRNFGINGVSIIQSKNLNIKGFMGAANGMIWHQPGTWLKYYNIMSISALDENFHYCFDGLMMLKYIIKFDKIIYINTVLVNFRLHEQSKTVAFARKFHEDRLLISILLLQDKNYFPKYSREIYDLIMKSTRIVKMEKQITLNNSKYEGVLLIIKNIIIDFLEYPYRYALGIIKRICNEKNS
jgi:glycosyltransferase involved in cell wall biosynthesis